MRSGGGGLGADAELDERIYERPHFRMSTGRLLISFRA
jgi:hypothetical protein